jgi:ABC-2 type transport system permease protein
VSSWEPVGMVARREVSTRLASKAFRITTAALLIAIVGFTIAIKVLGDLPGSKVGFTASTAVLAEPLRSVAEATGHKVTPSTVDDGTGEQQLRAGDLDALVTGTPGNFTVTVKQDLSQELRTEFQVLLRQSVLNDQIIRAGGNPATVATAVDSATLPVRTLEPAREFQTQRFVLSIIVGVLVYMALLIYGPAVAQGVVEEKSSRIVEILLTTMRPWQLMLGKVFGIGLMGLGQLVLVAGVGVLAGVATAAINFPASIVAGIAVWAVIWFLLGYVAYGLLFAALGALVSRQEDVAAVTAPLLMVVVLPYVLGISILPSDPHNAFLAATSMIPLFSPTLMPMRIALDAAPAWQIALSLGLTTLLIVGSVWLSGQVYGNAVMRIGSRVRLRDALRGT